MSEEQIKDMILKQCLELTTNNDFRPPISAYDGVDIDDVVRTCKQLQDKKTYLDLVKENQELKKQVEEYENELEKADSITQSCIFNGKKESEISFRKCLNMLEKHKNQQKEFISYLENEIYSIEPKGTGINYNCEYDSEEDYISAMKEQSKLNTLKEILSKFKEIIGDDK